MFIGGHFVSEKMRWLSGGVDISTLDEVSILVLYHLQKPLEIRILFSLDYYNWLQFGVNFRRQSNVDICILFAAFSPLFKNSSHNETNSINLNFILFEMWLFSSFRTFIFIILPHLILIKLFLNAVVNSNLCTTNKTLIKKYNVAP